MRESNKLFIPLTVSIITHNRVNVLIRCIESILDLHELPQEILIIDSSDGIDQQKTQAYLSGLAHHQKIITYKHVSHMSAGYSRNQSLHLAKYPLLCFVDDDEIVVNHWLKYLYQTFQRTHAALVVGPIYPMKPNNYWHKIWSYLTRNDYTPGNRYVKYANTGNMLIDKNQIGSITFDNLMKTSEDADFYINIIDNHLKIYYTHQAIVYHDYRSNFKGFVVQWFYYGYETTHILAKKNLGMRRWYSWKTFFQVLLDYGIITPLKEVPHQYIPGILLKNCAFITGAIIRRLLIFNGHLQYTYENKNT